MNDVYFDLLARYGFTVDCSVTPGISWADKAGYAAGGTDYSASPRTAYRVGEKLLELPVTIRKLRGVQIRTGQGMKKLCKDVLQNVTGKNVWLRPSISSLRDMEKLVDAAAAAGEYLEFMIHSSEFMPGGSPYYPTEKDVDGLFSLLDALFGYIRGRGYAPAFLRDAPALFPKED